MSEFINICGIDINGKYTEEVIETYKFNIYYKEKIKDIKLSRFYNRNLKDNIHIYSIREEAEIETIKKFSNIDTEKLYTLQLIKS